MVAGLSDNHHSFSAIPAQEHFLFDDGCEHHQGYVAQMVVFAKSGQLDNGPVGCAVEIVAAVKPTAHRLVRCKLAEESRQSVLNVSIIATLAVQILNDVVYIHIAPIAGPNTLKSVEHNGVFVVVQTFSRFGHFSQNRDEGRSLFAKILNLGKRIDTQIRLFMDVDNRRTFQLA